MFIRNCWYAAALSRELTATQPLARTVICEPLVLFRKRDGSPVALEDRCCHRHTPLSIGRCEGDSIRCMYHGLRFDAAGRCVEIPGQLSIADSMRVRAYPVHETAGWLWVWMGDAQRADTRILPIPPWFDCEDWDMRYGMIELKAGYTLINDNLCDFSHTAFVHEKTFAGGERTFAETLPQITSLERGIRVERWITDRRTIEEWLPEDAAPQPSAPPRLDQWIAYDYLVPGVMIMRVEMHAAGTGQRQALRAPSQEPLHANLGIHAVTPVTSDTSRYYYSLGPRSCETRATPGLASEMFAAAVNGFEEDRRTVEAQQENLRRWPLADMQAIRHDRGVLLMSSVMQRLQNEEGDSC
jgi:vanillate O-demethylase monooxygenase subunit